MKKRLLPFLICLTLLLGYSSCVQIENLEEDIIGTWRFNQVDYTSDLVRVTCPECSSDLTDTYEGQKMEFNDDFSFAHLDANDSVLVAGTWEVIEEGVNYFDRFGEVKAAGYQLDLSTTSTPEPEDFILRTTSKKKLDLVRLDTAGTYYMIMKPF